MSQMFVVQIFQQLSALVYINMSLSSWSQKSINQQKILCIDKQATMACWALHSKPPQLHSISQPSTRQFCKKSASNLRRQRRVSSVFNSSLTFSSKYWKKETNAPAPCRRCRTQEEEEDQLRNAASNGEDLGASPSRKSQRERLQGSFKTWRRPNLEE